MFPESPQFIGNSSIMRKINGYLQRVAAVDSLVLITGETGTGKELTAQSVHR
ncbi:MAG: sigma 54-interacting transcriptional regulator [Gammaproteobacteria bacterium]